ncbi:hypothetical protein DFH11DRAFT_144550 [Phellopilus nigrolimitatus]|nr:hypothetical protein DFH11DRAFT_144550 [Phellopilus nigrolimitatus]
MSNIQSSFDKQPNLFKVAEEQANKNVIQVDSEFYNSLPLVEDAAEAADKMQSVRDELASIMTEHNVADIFSVRLVHKHFDMLPGEMATFRKVTVPDVCDAIVMGPVKPTEGVQLYGKNFAVNNNGELVAYEFTTDANTGGDVGQYPEFVKKVTELLVRSGACAVFGLSWEPLQEDEQYTEFELADERSTVMVPAAIFPRDASDTILDTNWFSLVKEAKTNCTVTRSGKHYGCNQTRSGKHYGVQNVMQAAKEGKGHGLMDNSPFWKAMQDPTSDLFKVVDHVAILI